MRFSPLILYLEHVLNKLKMVQDIYLVKTLLPILSWKQTILLFPASFLLLLIVYLSKFLSLIILRKQYMPPLLPSCWLPVSCHAGQELTCLISCSCLFLPPPPPDVTLLTQHQRGSIYTENKPLGRLCKMCNSFFHEFRVIPSANGF